MRSQSRVTLADVAAAAGVSPMTASYAYSQPGRVATATRQRVLDAAAQLGYLGPDPSGRFLRQGSLRSLGLVLGEDLAHVFDDPASTAFVAGLARTCTSQGYGLSLLPTLAAPTTPAWSPLRPSTPSWSGRPRRTTRCSAPCAPPTAAPSCTALPRRLDDRRCRRDRRGRRGCEERGPSRGSAASASTNEPLPCPRHRHLAGPERAGGAVVAAGQGPAHRSSPRSRPGPGGTAGDPRAPRRLPRRRPRPGPDLGRRRGRGLRHPRRAAGAARDPRAGGRRGGRPGGHERAAGPRRAPRPGARGDGRGRGRRRRWLRRLRRRRARRSHERGAVAGGAGRTRRPPRAGTARPGRARRLAARGARQHGSPGNAPEQPGPPAQPVRVLHLAERSAWQRPWSRAGTGARPVGPTSTRWASCTPAPRPSCRGVLERYYADLPLDGHELLVVDVAACEGRGLPGPLGGAGGVDRAVPPRARAGAAGRRRRPPPAAARRRGSAVLPTTSDLEALGVPVAPPNG